MDKPKVSLIVPIYNVERYFYRCMDSLLNQTLKEIEIILVDDGSPDNCPGMCDEYAQKDNRVKVIHKKNGGLGFARNSGLEVATGEFIAFVDSDDYVDHHIYETLYNQAKKLELDTIFCGFNKVDTALNIVPVSDVTSTQIFETHKDIVNALLDMVGAKPEQKEDRKFQMSVWHAIYSKTLLDKYNIRFHSEREFISEDIIFHIDYLQKAQKIAFIAEPMYYYCANEASLSNAFHTNRFDRFKTLHTEINKRLSLISDINQYQLIVDRLFIGYLRTFIFQIGGYDNVSAKEKYLFLKKICKDDIWKQIFSRYPIRKLPLKYGFVLICIKYCQINLLLLISKSVNRLR